MATFVRRVGVSCARCRPRRLVVGPRQSGHARNESRRAKQLFLVFFPLFYYYFEVKSCIEANTWFLVCTSTICIQGL